MISKKMISFVVISLITTSVFGFIPTALADEVIAEQTDFVGYYSLPEYYICIAQSVNFGSNVENLTKIEVRFDDPPAKADYPLARDWIYVGISNDITNNVEEWEVVEYRWAYECDGWETFDFSDLDVSSETECYIMVSYFKIGENDGNIGLNVDNENPYPYGFVQTYSYSEGWQTQSKADICFKLYGEYGQDAVEDLTVDAGGPYIGSKDSSIQFNGKVEGGVPPYEYTWDFGDGKNSNDKNPTHKYSDAGGYEVKFNVKDSTGQTASDSTYSAIGNSYEKRNAVILVGNAFGSAPHCYDMVTAAQKMYDCLTSNKYGFKDNEIHVLSQYDFSDIVDKTSTKENVRKTLESIKDSDLFLFMYIGHGVFESYDSPQYFLLDNAEKLCDDDLQEYVKDIKGQHIYLLHACNSAGFIPELSKSSSNRIICASTGLGYLTTDYMLEGWVHFFIDALNGAGDSIHDGFISIEEAFYYAEQKTYRKCDPINGDLGQEPVLDDNGDNEGHSPHTGEYTRFPNNPNYDGHYASVNSLNMGPKEVKIKQKSTTSINQNIFQKLIENFVFIKSIIQNCPILKQVIDNLKNLIY